MAGSTPAYVLDTNILLRLYKPDSPEFSLIRQAVSSLHHTNAAPYYFPQNLVEFWNVSTRPATHNGYGLSAAETEKVAKEIENTFTLLPEVNRIHREWRRQVVEYGVSGT